MPYIVPNTGGEAGWTVEPSTDLTVTVNPARVPEYLGTTTSFSVGFDVVNDSRTSVASPLRTDVADTLKRNGAIKEFGTL